MFNGIIKDLGAVVTVKKNEHILTFDAPSLHNSLSISDSIAVNGVCLTVVGIQDSIITTDVMEETFKRSNLGMLQEGDVLNLELPITPETMISGHLVYGHVDATAILKTVIPEENAFIVRFELNDPELARYIVEKGSIAINGISLTIIDIEDSLFSVGIIPHTWENTNISRLVNGNNVNIEVDMLAKYVEKLVTQSK